ASGNPTMRYAVYALCFLFAITGIGHAQGDKPKPNTLTPKEIADSWILLFDGETTFGWESKGKVRVEDGTLVLPDHKAAIKHSTTWQDLELRFDCRMKTPPKEDSEGGGIELRGTDISQGLPDGEDWSECRCVFETRRKLGVFDLRIWTN